MFWVVYYSLFLYFLYLTKKTRNAHVPLLFLMIFFLGQRWMTGEDFPGYLLYYLIDFKGVDIGFFALQDTFKYFDFSFSLFVLFIYTVTLSLTYKFINKFQYASLVFVVFSITELSFIQLSQLKQSLAIPFMLFSYYYFYNKKYLYGLVFIVFSSSLHVASFFLLPFLFFRVPVKKSTMMLLLAIVCVLPFLNITAIVPTSLYFKFGHYLDSEYNQSLSLFHYFKLYGIIIIFYILYRSNSMDSLLDKRLILSGMFIYIFLYSLSFQFAPFMRFSYFFRVFEVIALINLAMDSNIRRCFSYYVFPFYSLSFLVICILDPYNVSRYSFEPVRFFEHRTDSQLYLEIDKFYEEK